MSLEVSLNEGRSVEYSKTHGDLPAFPDPSGRFAGLTVRQEFAKAAMQGFCGNSHISTSGAGAGLSNEVLISRLSQSAVMVADALIEALGAGGAK